MPLHVCLETSLTARNASIPQATSIAVKKSKKKFTMKQVTTYDQTTKRIY